MAARVDPGEVERPVGGLTCFLLGWTGAAPKHVEKYADAYRERFAGAAVVVVTGHCQIGVSEPFTEARYDEVAKAVLPRLQAAAAGPTVVHLFSNGGGMLWCALGRLMRRASDAARRHAAHPESAQRASGRAATRGAIRTGAAPSAGGAPNGRRSDRARVACSLLTRSTLVNCSLHARSGMRPYIQET